MAPEEVRLTCIEYVLRLAEMNEGHPTLERLTEDAKELEEYAWNGKVQPDYDKK